MGTGGAPASHSTYPSEILEHFIRQPYASIESFDFDTGPRELRNALSADLDASPNLGPFFKRGGKLIIWHGWADAAISPLMTIDYYEKALQRSGPLAKEHMRLLMIPGLQHCAGGTGAGNFGQMSAPMPGTDPERSAGAAIQAWVEQGRVPDHLVGIEAVPASFGGGSKPDAREHLLCAYPAMPSLKAGAGASNASAYSCRPRRLGRAGAADQAAPETTRERILDMTEQRHTVCRICQVACDLIVNLEDGEIRSIHGNKDNPVYHGFSCIKGRSAGDLLTLPSRLLHSQERQADGSFREIEAGEAARRAGARLNAIIAEHGPRSVGMFIGTYCTINPLFDTIARAFMGCIGSPMVIDNLTIDQPGTLTGAAMHGSWLAGHPPMDEWDALLLVGANPIVSMNGGLGVNPARQLKRMRERGMKLVVIDPRRTECAEQADIHLQAPARPGCSDHGRTDPPDHRRWVTGPGIH